MIRVNREGKAIEEESLLPFLTQKEYNVIYPKNHVGFISWLEYSTSTEIINAKHPSSAAVWAHAHLDLIINQ